MDTAIILSELGFKAIRSSGPGGQHVNKVSSKVEITFNVQTSKGLTDDEKQLIIEKIKSQLTKDLVLIVKCDTTRSQLKNKELAVKKLLKLLQQTLVIKKKRKPTKPTKSSIEKRLEKKKKDAFKKALRKNPRI
jgi:ribosome-associated protein